MSDTPKTDAAAKMIDEYLGQRCTDYDENCMTCVAWRLYDDSASMRAQLEASERRGTEPLTEPHVIKQIEHALQDNPAGCTREMVDYIRGCISDYRHSLTKSSPPAHTATDENDSVRRPVDVAAAIAHRACCGEEHDPANGKLHGCCIVCGVPWPCDTAKYFLRPAPAAEGELRIIRFTRCTFDGDPPDGFSSWFHWAAAPELKEKCR